MSENISYIARTKQLKKWKEINQAYEGIREKQRKIRDFMNRDKSQAVVIPAEELKNHDTALFEVLARTLGGRVIEDPWACGWSLSDILVDFRVDTERGTVTAVKIYECMSGSELETRTYYLENYGKTWRAWDALPER